MLTKMFTRLFEDLVHMSVQNPPTQITVKLVWFCFDAELWRPKVDISPDNMRCQYYFWNNILVTKANMKQEGFV